MKCFSAFSIPRASSLKDYLISVTLSIALAFASPALAGEAATHSKLAINSLLLDAAQQARLMVAVGERGHILYSTDQGHNWVQAEVPTRALLTGIHLHDDALGWAVGHDATILRTDDGAKTWQVIYSNVEEETPLLDVWFKDAQHGFAVGAYGLFLSTQDGGQSWQQSWISEEDDFHLNHITAMADGTLVIAAEAGVVYLSDDEGKTWLPLPSPYQGSFFGSLPTGAQSLFLFGLRGHLFTSSDKGEQWTEIETGTTAMLTAGLKNKNGRCYISGLSGILIIAPRCDGSEIDQKQLSERSGIAAMLESDDAIILVGESGITRFTP